jgi:hypothetical protein
LKEPVFIDSVIISRSDTEIVSNSVIGGNSKVIPAGIQCMRVGSSSGSGQDVVKFSEYGDWKIASKVKEMFESGGGGDVLNARAAGVVRRRKNFEEILNEGRNPTVK